MICTRCGGPLPAGSTLRRMFCSKGCKQADRRDTERAARLEAISGRSCKWCGGPVAVTKRRHSEYCCKACKRRGQYIRAIGIPGAQTCRHCGQSFVSAIRQSYCSRRCSAKSRVDDADMVRNRGAIVSVTYFLTPERFDELASRKLWGVRLMRKRVGRPARLSAIRFDAMWSARPVHALTAVNFDRAWGQPGKFP